MTELAEFYRIVNPQSLEDLTRQANRIFAFIADRHDSQEGRRGTPTFHANVDMGGNRATSGSAALVNDDLPTLDQIPLFDDIYPIGSVYISVNSTNPGTLFTGTTWTSFGSGRVLVGLDAGDADFNTPLKTGGAKTSTISAHTHAIAAHRHPLGTNVVVSAPDGQVYDGQDPGMNTGSGGSANPSIVQPYVVVYMWYRTA